MHDSCIPSRLTTLSVTRSFCCMKVHALHLGMTTQIIRTVAKHPTEEAVMTIVSQLITMVSSHQCVNRLLEDPFYRAMEGVALHHRGAKPAHKDVINQAYNCLTEGRQILQEAAE